MTHVEQLRCKNPNKDWWGKNNNTLCNKKKLDVTHVMTQIKHCVLEMISLYSQEKH